MAQKNNELKWIPLYAQSIPPIMRFANEYTRFSKTPGYFGAEIKLTVSDYQVIEKIFLNEGRRMNMSALAEELGITQSAFSKIVQRMEKIGFVEKFHTAGNRKDIILCISEYGKKNYAAYQQYVEKHILSKIHDLVASLPMEHIETYNEILRILGQWPILDNAPNDAEPELIPVSATKG